MLESGGRGDLAAEPVGPHGHRQGGAEDLERDRPVVLDVPRQVDRRHAAASQLVLDGVGATQPGLKYRARVGPGIGQGRARRSRVRVTSVNDTAWGRTTGGPRMVLPYDVPVPQNEGFYIRLDTLL